MKKIRLSDTDIEMFDLEVSPHEFVFFQKHKDLFRCMWKDQGKHFWTKFTITFRSYTVKHGVIKQLAFDAQKFESMLDDAFIYIHEQFVDGKEGMARGFIEDCVVLARNQDKLPQLDSRSVSKDPFFLRETRDIFRRFFGPPDVKKSYVKVYILMPVYLRYTGSICRCLKKWMEAPTQACEDDTYWTPPTPSNKLEGEAPSSSSALLCMKCLDECSVKYYRERLCGHEIGPKFVDLWDQGDPRFNDPKNPLYNPKSVKDSDWRDELTTESYKDFMYYVRGRFGQKCLDCASLADGTGESEPPCSEGTVNKKKKKKKKKTKNSTCKVETYEEICGLPDHKDPQEVKKMKEKIGQAISATYNTPPPFLGAGLANKKAAVSIIKIPLNKSQKEQVEKYKKDPNNHDLAEAIFSKNLTKDNVVGGFNIVKKEDDRTGAMEIIVTLTAVKTDNDGKSLALPDSVSNSCTPYSVTHLRKAIENLPDKMEWFEGKGFCACVLDYEKEEGPKATNFNIKVTGTDEVANKITMYNLLSYVGKRKKRSSVGWTMEDHDVVACILPDDSHLSRGVLVIHIQKGYGLQGLLTSDEKRSVNNEIDEFPEDALKDKIVMVLDGGVAMAMVKLPDARKILKKLIIRVYGHCADETRGLGTADYETFLVEKMTNYHFMKYGFVLNSLDELSVDRIVEDILSSVKQAGFNFETIFTVEENRQEELEAIGLKRVDFNEADRDNEHSKLFNDASELVATLKVCRKCNSIIFDCTCFDKKRIEEIYKGCNCCMCVKEQRSNFVEPVKEKPKAAVVEKGDGYSKKPEKMKQKLNEKEHAERRSQIQRTLDALERERLKMEKGQTAEEFAEGLKQPRGSFITFQNDKTGELMVPQLRKKTTSAETDTSPTSKQENPKTETDTPPTNKQENPKKEADTSPTNKQENPKKETDTPPTNKKENPKTETDTPPTNKKENPKKETDTPPTSKKENPKTETDTLPTKKQVKLKTETDTSPINKQGNLKTCANCSKIEPSPKTYKKCQKCKVEGVAKARYYCNRECQVEDWIAKHKVEHKENKL